MTARAKRNTPNARNVLTPDLLCAAALKFHVLRANFVSMMWKASCASFIPILPDRTTDNGWELEDNLLAAIMTDMLPAPKFSIELSSCHCKKTKCLNKQCTCAKNKLRCTELCDCIDCENVEELFAELSEDENFDLDDDFDEEPDT